MSSCLILLEELMKLSINPQILALLSRVMPIAFTSPLFGALMGILFASEPLTPKTVVGMGLTVGGIVVLSI